MYPRKKSAGKNFPSSRKNFWHKLCPPQSLPQTIEAGIKVRVEQVGLGLVGLQGEGTLILTPIIRGGLKCSQQRFISEEEKFLLAEFFG